MDEILKAAIAFESLFNIEYKIITGRKGKTTEFTIGFRKSDFFHLVGLQKLKDIDFPTKSKEKLFDLIITGKINDSFISKSKYYKSDDNNNYIGVKERLSYFCNIDKIMDSNNIIFKYNANRNRWSEIKAEFVLENKDYKKIVYVFIDKDTTDNKRFCRSFFPKGKVDFTAMNTKLTLLYKEKIDKTKRESIIQLDKISVKEDKKYIN